MVRKIGIPFQPELAAAAVVDGDAPELVVNREVVRITGMSDEEIEAGKERQLAEIARRRDAWLRDRAPVPVEGRDAIVVDDGIATGATARAALRALRRRGARSVTLAVPVCPADTLRMLDREVDHLVCLMVPEPFHAIGAHYRDFTQLGDEDVVRLLAEADRLAAHGGG
jgi:putative phosphoribosyl transferase